MSREGNKKTSFSSLSNKTKQNSRPLLPLTKNGKWTNMTASPPPTPWFLLANILVCPSPPFPSFSILLLLLHWGIVFWSKKERKQIFLLLKLHHHHLLLLLLKVQKVSFCIYILYICKSRAFCCFFEREREKEF